MVEVEDFSFNNGVNLHSTFHKHENPKWNSHSKQLSGTLIIQVLIGLFISTLVEDPRSLVGERRMGKPINPYGIYNSMLLSKNKAAWLAVSAPVAHGGKPPRQRWQVFRSDRKTRKRFGLRGRCYVSLRDMFAKQSVRIKLSSSVHRQQKSNYQRC